MSELITTIGPFGFLIVICAVYYTIKHQFFALPRYRLRAESIAKHGWPPVGMDADGDWHGEKRDDNEQ